MFKKIAPALFALVVRHLSDICGVVGLGLLVYGVALLSKPAAFIVAGALVIAGVLLISRNAPAKKTEE